MVENGKYSGENAEKFEGNIEDLEETVEIFTEDAEEFEGNV
jgi:hypothetical protein